MCFYLSENGLNKRIDELKEMYGETPDYVDSMFSQLAKISNKTTVLAVSMNKAQKVHIDLWKRVEKQSIGKRKFEIYTLK